MKGNHAKYYNLKVMLSAVKENKAGEGKCWFRAVHQVGWHLYVRVVRSDFPNSEVIF